MKFHLPFLFSSYQSSYIKFNFAQLYIIFQLYQEINLMDCKARWDHYEHLIWPHKPKNIFLD